MHQALFIALFICLGLVDVSLQQCSDTFPYSLNSTTNLKSTLPQRLKLGVLGSFAPNDFLAVLALAHEFNNNPDILPNVGIDIYSSPSPLSSTDALLGSLFYSTTLKVHGLIGGAQTTEAATIQLAAKIYTIPQITSTSLSYTLSNKDEYPYLARTIPPNSVLIDAMIALFQKFNWKKAILVYSYDDYGKIVVAAAAQNISFFPVSIPFAAVNASQVASGVASITQAITQQDYRILLYYSSITPGTLVRVALNNSGFVGPDFVSLVTTATMNTYLSRDFGDYPLNDGVLGFTVSEPSGSIFDYLKNLWNSTSNPYPYPTTPVTSSTWYMVDSFLNYVYTVDKLIKVGIPFANINGSMLYDALIANNFTGTTGTVAYDKNGDRLGNYAIYMMNRRGNILAAEYSSLQGNITVKVPFVFSGNRTTIPRDSPYRCAICEFGTCVEDVGCVCQPGYAGISCDVNTVKPAASMIWIVAVVGVMVIGLAIGIYVYRRKRRMLVQEVVDKQRSNITKADLQMKERIGRGASGEVFRATYRGTDVAVKKIITTNSDKSVVKEFELEVAIMCGLRHPNIILFMGSCYDAAAKEMLLVMEYMTRGSLHDVIHNPQIELNYQTSLHLACQAAQGINFLHQSAPPIIHRDLKSHNILLDDKWNARISDFGITSFKNDQKNSKATHEKSIGTIYWSSPESLDGSAITEKADCYSFGIVLWEIFHRQNPYKGRDPTSVALEVIRSRLRPRMNPEIPTEMKDLICACWDQDPEKRPSFQDITTTLRSLSMKNPTHAIGRATTRVEAPTGNAYLVNTEIIGAYSIWEDKPKVMCEAMKLHNGLIRTNLEMYRGYESQYDLHSFLIAFATLEEAMNFCIATQISLLHVKWPQDLLSNPLCQEVKNSAGNLLWRGLRVKMALVSGVSNCEIDPCSNRTIYIGPVVKKSEKILRSTNREGIVVADTIVDEINKKGLRFVQPVKVHKCGEVSTARDPHSSTHRVVVSSLADRENSASPAHPHVMVDVEEITMPGSHRKQETPAVPQKVSWIVPYDELDVKENVGKGAIGDCFRAYWKSKEVAVKVLVNQKLKEDDLLRLLGDASYMSTMTHPNILPFHAVCLDDNHLSMISEFMPRGNLKAILADTSIQLPMLRRARIAQEIANGMSYLTTLSEPDMKKHDNLKSNNILIGKDWEVKIADYGQSNIKELARTMTSVGSVAWTAPEILIGEAEITPEIAIYSFGIIMWEILTRQVPYVGEHPIRVVTKILGGYRPPIPPGTPAMWAELITECLAGPPEDRPSWNSIISRLGAIAREV